MGKKETIFFFFNSLGTLSQTRCETFGIWPQNSPVLQWCELYFLVRF